MSRRLSDEERLARDIAEEEARNKETRDERERNAEIYDLLERLNRPAYRIPADDIRDALVFLLENAKK